MLQEEIKSSKCAPVAWTNKSLIYYAASNFLAMRSLNAHASYAINMLSFSKQINYSRTPEAHKIVPSIGKSLVNTPRSR